MSDLSKVAARQAEADAQGSPVATRAVDLISALRRADGAFAPREQNVANYVLENLEAVSQMAIADLAAACDVSTPTVIRFCRTLGCEGFRDFKIKLARNVAVSLQYLAPRPSLDQPREASPFDTVLNAIYATLERTQEQLDQAVFDAVTRRLSGSSQILFSGVGGGSSIVAKDAANRFFRLGIPTVFVNDSYILQMRAATLQRMDTFFAISASGEAREIAKAVEVANDYGATTIGLTRANSTLAGLCTYAIVLDLPEDLDIHKPTASRFAHLMIVDSLATAVAQLQPTLTNESLRRVRASLTAFHGRIGPQPLGD